MPRLELIFPHSASADGSNVGRLLLASSRFRFSRDVRMIAYLVSIHAPAWRATLSIIDIRPGRAEAERKVIADVQKIVAIWNARQADVHGKDLRVVVRKAVLTRGTGLAWGDLQNEWHRVHGLRWPASQCAGCDAPIGGLRTLDLPDGNRVHFEPIDCLINFGNRWRSAANTALIGLGLEPPHSDGGASTRWVRRSAASASGISTSW
jgi:hypothetical protein